PACPGREWNVGILFIARFGPPAKSRKRHPAVRRLRFRRRGGAVITRLPIREAVMAKAVGRGDLVKLVRILGLLGSDHDGERASAALAAHRLVQRMETDWWTLLGGQGPKRLGAFPERARIDPWSDF